jgi:hypothetical protein
MTDAVEKHIPITEVQAGFFFVYVEVKSQQGMLNGGEV